MRKILTTLLFLVILPYFISAQETFKIKGKVTDAKTGEPLIGASVILKPWNLGAATDLDGNYSFDVPTDVTKGQLAELVASFINYKKKSVTVTLRGTSITQNFALEEDVFQSEEIVVTGIASKTSRAVAEVAVSRVSAAELQQVNTYGTLSQIVQGKVAGVQMSTSSGNVGSGWRFFVRGGAGLNGDGQPIIYIDGTRVDNSEVIGYGVGGQGNSTLANLNTNDIEKIEFLKGPAAAATYGTSGSNGVVLITTKSGKAGLGATLPISFDYKFNYGFNERQYKYSLGDYVSANEANRNFTKGPIRENILNIAGGFSYLKYFASFENRSENSILPANFLTRNSVRLKVSAIPNEKVSVVAVAGYSRSNINRPTNDNIIYGWLGNTLLYPDPYLFIPELSLRAINDNNSIKTFLGSINTTYRPIENLELFGSVGTENADYFQQRLYPFGFNFGGLVGTRGEKSIYQRNVTSYTYDFNAKYLYKLFDEVNVSSLVGLQFYDKATRQIFLQGQQMGTGYITSIGSTASVTDYGEDFFNSREGGIFTEHNFSYLGQYFLTLRLRRDYSTLIGKDAPAIIYPGASFAIRLDKYGFLPSFFNLVKFRAAYGESGTLPQPLEGIQYYWVSEKGGYGGGAVLGGLGNSNLQPERVRELEGGLDLELFNELSLEFTYYRRDVNNSIIGIPLASSTGKTVGGVPFNIGGIKDWGFETQLQYNPIRTADYNLNLGLILNYQNNKVTSLGGAAPVYAGFNSSNTIQPGLPRSEFYAPKVLGALFNANGTYNTGAVNTTADRVRLGNPIPNYNGSVTINFKFLKNFLLYVFGDFALKNKMYNYTRAFAANTGNNPDVNRYRALLGLPELYTGVAPKDITPLTPNTPEYVDIANKLAKLDGRYVDNFIEAADYFYLREVSLSYNLTDLLGEFDLLGYVKNITVGIMGRNLIRFTKYSGSDIEINSQGARTVARGIDFLTLQTPRTVNFWVRLGI